MSDVGVLVQRIFRQKYLQRLVRLEETVISVAASQLNLDVTDAEIFAYRKIRSIWDDILRRLDEEARKGISPTFEVVDEDRYELAWYPYISSGDSNRETIAKRRLAYRGEILDYIDNSIDDREYEALGCMVAQLAGATRWHLTPRGNEFGIDFLAIIPSFGKTHLFPGSHKQIRLVGQSKKWMSRVKRDKVDDLAHKLDYVRARSHHVDHVLPSWFVSSKGIVVGCMLAHYGTQSGGHTIADDHGIILADSRDVAEMLSLCRRWDLSAGAAGATYHLKCSISSILSTS